MANYYEILEVSKTATDAEIKSAFRRLARKYHPDTNKEDKNAEEKFKELNTAYEVLRNALKRKDYDRNLGKSHASSKQENKSPEADTSKPRSKTRTPPEYSKHDAAEIKSMGWVAKIFTLLIGLFFSSLLLVIGILVAVRNKDNPIIQNAVGFFNSIEVSRVRDNFEKVGETYRKIKEIVSSEEENVNYDIKVKPDMPMPELKLFDEEDVILHEIKEFISVKKPGETKPAEAEKTIYKKGSVKKRRVL
jgi:curved DNA-binding protein CbpA